ncbi:MAG: hypothetical protein KF748_08030 [Xanthobacteraceae bacterium]|nr:hypothetical protein [Xanthobacteraceae bacterium]MCW5676618.1 hypothetical protein [Xanthobacteraceae bacterium]
MATQIDLLKIGQRLMKLRRYELRLARRNPYDKGNAKKYLVRAYLTQVDIIRLCSGSRARAKSSVDAWFCDNPFGKSEGSGPKTATGRSKVLFASILAATSRAPRRLQSRWSRAFFYIDWEHGGDLSKPKLEWVLEDQGGLRKLATYAAQTMPGQRRSSKSRRRSSGAGNEG